RELAMTKYLGWIAVGGIAVGVVATALVANVGGHEAFGMSFKELRNLAALSDSCSGEDSDVKVSPNATERHLAWNGGDTVNIAVPSTVHFHGGEGDDVIVRGAARDIAHVRIDGDWIRGEHCHGFGNGHQVDITLPGRAFHTIGLSGAGTMILENVQQ